MEKCKVFIGCVPIIMYYAAVHMKVKYLRVGLQYAKVLR